jgi:hypothetical protein
MPSAFAAVNPNLASCFGLSDRFALFARFAPEISLNKGSAVGAGRDAS